MKVINCLCGHVFFPGILVKVDEGKAFVAHKCYAEGPLNGVWEVDQEEEGVRACGQKPLFLFSQTKLRLDKGPYS